MDKLIFNVLMGIVVVLAGYCARVVMPYIRQKQEELTVRLRKAKWGLAADIIEAVVMAVEQTVSSELHGETKKQLAVQYIKKFFRANDIDISEDQISALIEAAVHAMNANTIEVGTEIPEDQEDETEKTE